MKKKNWNKVQIKLLGEKYEFFTDDLFQSIIMDFMEVICDKLDIEVPFLGVSKDYMSTPTTMAVYRPKDNVIFLNPDYCIGEILSLMFFSVAHELRHKWQYNNFGIDIFSKSRYKKSSELSLEEYNSQDVEIDANYYAIKYMDKHYKGWDTYGLHKQLMEMGCI